MSDKIYVTKPSLPDLKDFIPYIEKIWENRWLTNDGPFHEKFEEELAKFLGVKYISLFTNGTLALVAALQVLKVSGEVITTPYTFVATSHALWWNNIKPVFVDVEPDFCNIDASKIESAITPKTTAILPVHVYGNPCEVDKIQEIADIYGLKVIYDAAHAFGVKYNNTNICNYGDLSILSFHATKMFNTMEGGAIICNDAATKKRIGYIKNFGFLNETSVVAPGINSKMNEIQASLGLLQIKMHEKNLYKRKLITELYKSGLHEVKGIRFLYQKSEVDYNYSYFPIFVLDDYPISRDELYDHLKKNNIYSRRYFYPLISHFPMYKGLESSNPNNLVVAEKIASQVICLPIYPDLSHDDVKKIISLIK